MYSPIQHTSGGWNVGRVSGRSLHKLSALGVSKQRQPGYYGDGGGLWLQVSPSGTKSWIFRFTLNGKAREMGLGPYPDVPLAGRVEQVASDEHGSTRQVVIQGAREKAAECRDQVRQGIDPIEARTAGKQAARVAAALVRTFDQCRVRPPAHADSSQSAP